MSNRYSFENWFAVDKNWMQNFQFKNFLPLSDSWKYSSFLPKLTFFSVFGDRKTIERNKSKYKVFWTGEDVTVNHADYKDNAVGLCDLSIGFSPEDAVNADNYIRYPLWLLYYFGNHKRIEDIEQEIELFNKRWHEFSEKKNKFCALVASHDKYGTRKELFDLLNPYQRVSGGGKIFHNDDSLVNEFADDKQKYLEQFMFNMCPENVSAPGYTTEKIFQSFDSGCIPIYFGSEGVVEPEVVDNSKIIFYNGQNGDEVLQKVRELYENKNLYNTFMKNSPIKKSAAEWIYGLNLKLQKKFEKIVLVR